MQNPLKQTASMKITFRLPEVGFGGEKKSMPLDFSLSLSLNLLLYSLPFVFFWFRLQSSQYFNLSLLSPSPLFRSLALDYSSKRVNVINRIIRRASQGRLNFKKTVCFSVKRSGSGRKLLYLRMRFILSH